MLETIVFILYGELLFSTEVQGRVPAAGEKMQYNNSRYSVEGVLSNYDTGRVEVYLQ